MTMVVVGLPPFLPEVEELLRSIESSKGCRNAPLSMF